VGWTQSRLPNSGGSGLRNVRPSAYTKFGTSYLTWTKYGFLLNTAADLTDPGRTVLLFDGDMWHSNSGRELINGLFADGHAQT
jgi:prepilin-type processing-associated H-X9-DG protein